jgi:enterochelin esterase family protein
MGVFSMGLQTGVHAGVKSDFEERNATFLANSEQTNRMLRLFWIACGNNDHLIADGARRLSALLKRYGIRHEFHASEGGHTWINWRQYLRDFLPRLFRAPGVNN